MLENRNTQLPDGICRVMALRFAMVAVPLLVISGLFFFHPCGLFILSVPTLITAGYLHRLFGNPGRNFRFFTWLITGLILGCFVVIAWVKWISEWESLDDRLRFSVVIICWLFIDCLILLRFDISNPRTGKRSNRPLIAFPEIVPRLIAIRLTFFGGFFLTKLFGIFFFHCVLLPLLPIFCLVFLGYILRIFGHPNPFFLRFTWSTSAGTYMSALAILLWLLVGNANPITLDQWMALALLLWPLSDSAVMLRLDLADNPNPCTD